MKETKYDQPNGIYYYLSTVKSNSRIITSMDAYENVYSFFSFSMFANYREKFFAIYLDKEDRPVSRILFSSLSMPHIILDFTKLIEEAKMANVANVIISHNSVTNNTNPTEQDDHLTKTFQSVFDQIGIGFRDHLIISEYGKYYSYADEGRL